MKRYAVFAVAGILALLDPSSATAQSTVTGQVVNSETLQPLVSVQISIADQGIGTLTNSEGNYVLTNVAEGEVTVAAQLVGYGAESATLQVSGPGSVRQDFQLESQAISLDEVVVTGTGAPARRRQLGQTISSVSAEQLEMAPVTNVADMLQARIPGLTAQAVGESGSAPKIILRGTSSLSQRNEPLIYVDGIRMDNSRAIVSGLSANRLTDINPDDIERIEVIKGAAAATLFGTEASSGVIQIFTKRGVAQDPVFSFSVDQQAIHIPNTKWPLNAQYHAEEDSIYTNKPAEDLVDIGWHQNYNLSVRGGSAGVQYFLSGRYMDEDGAMPVNDLSNASLRSAFDVTHSDRLRATVDLGWTKSTVRTAQPEWSSLASDFTLVRPNRATPEFPYGRTSCQCWDIPNLLNFTSSSESKNVLLAATVAYDFRENLVGTIRAGYNDVTLRGITFRPEGITPPGEGFSRGLRRVDSDHNNSTTLDARLTWRASLTDRISSEFTTGGQSFWESRVRQFVAVQDFASPSLKTLRGGSNITGVDESHEEVINAGIFAQEQIGLDDRLFLTAGIRMDGNSAFGEDFGFSFYPKAGLSWVISDYGFFNVPNVDQLRVRGAVGTSGLQPGAFDAQRTWQPGQFAGGLPIVTPQNLGNPDLQPERSTEWEGAIEMGLFDGRLALEAIYYNQVTTDALLPLAPPPSGGFSQAQLVNIGELTSQGVELMGNFEIVNTPSFSWSANASYTIIDQLITDMGEVPDFRVTGRRRFNWIAEGYAPGKVIAPVQDPANPYTLAVPVEELTSLDQIESNILRNPDGSEKLEVIGNALPTWTTNFGMDFRIGSNLNVRALFFGAGGFVMSNETEIIRSVGRINPLTANMTAKLADPATTVEERQAIADEFGRRHPGVISSYMEDGDWLKLNEVTIAYQIPASFANRLGLESSSISIGGRNLYLWTKYSGMLDPGTTVRVDGVESEFLQNIDYISTPTPSRYTVSFRTSW